MFYIRALQNSLTDKQQVINYSNKLFFTKNYRLFIKYYLCCLNLDIKSPSSHVNNAWHVYLFFDTLIYKYPF